MYLLLVLQVWGGGLYLLNKIFLSRAERSEGEKKRLWLISSWIVYLIGSPPWIIIYALEGNWMVVSVAVSSIIPKALGLINAVRGIEKTPKWLKYFSFFAVSVGAAISFYNLGFITTITQVLELVIVIGFLFGTYSVANQNPAGYIGFMVMNGFNAILVGIQGYPWLTLQQLASLGFIVDAYRMQKKKQEIARLMTSDIQ